MSIIISDMSIIGFLWANTSLSLVYEITIVSNELRKQLTMGKNERKKMDKSKVWNMKRTQKKNSSALDKSRISFSKGYLFFESRMKNELT